MLYILMTLLGIVLFTPFILLAGQTSKDDKRMLARFALLQSGGPGGLTSGANEGLLKNSVQGSAGWLEPLFTRLNGVLQLQVLLHQADSGLTSRRLLLMCFGAGLGTLFIAILVLHTAAVALLLSAGAAYVPIFVLRSSRKRRVAAMDKALPDVIDMMSRALRAGHSIAAAISIVAEQATQPASTEFSEVFRKQKFGLPLRDALMELLERVPSQDLRVLVAGILVQRDTGGNLTQILDRTSAVIRERLKLQGDIRVHTAQGRMTGWILCSLPLVMLVLINLVNPGYSKPLTDSPLGRKCLYTGVVLLVVGALLIKRIVSRIEV